MSASFPYVNANIYIDDNDDNADNDVNNISLTRS